MYGPPHANGVCRFKAVIADRQHVQQDPTAHTDSEEQYKLGFIKADKIIYPILFWLLDRKRQAYFFLSLLW